MTIMRAKHSHAAAHRHALFHPHPSPTLEVEDMPGADDVPDLEPELRYRMVSEAAYHRYLDRGCVDGWDVDDWLTAEADVERELRGASKLFEG
jgi:hypothetical protein